MEHCSHCSAIMANISDLMTGLTHCMYTQAYFSSFLKIVLPVSVNVMLQTTRWIHKLYFLSSCLQNQVIAALSSKSWDVETATELLLNNWKPSRCEDLSLPSSWHQLLPGTLPPPPFNTRAITTVWASYIGTLFCYCYNGGSTAITRRHTTLLPV